MNNQGGMGGYGAGGAGGPPGQPGQPAQPQYIPADQQPQYYQSGYGGGGPAQTGIGAPPNPMGYANSPQQQYAAARSTTGTTAAPSGGGYSNYYGGQPAPGGTQGYAQQPPQQLSMYGMQQQPQIPSSGSTMYGSGSTGSSAPPPNTNFGMTPAYTSSTISSASFGSMNTATGSGMVPIVTAPLAPFGTAPTQHATGGMLLQQAPITAAAPLPQPVQPQPATAPTAASVANPVIPQSQQQQATAVATKVSNPYSAEVLDHLDRFTVPDLCNIGRELVADLNYRTSVLCTTFKAVSDRKPYTIALEPQLEYCQHLLKKILEIRLRIEQDMPKNQLTTESFIEMLREPGEPERSEQVIRYEKIFADNRMKLINLVTDLKMTDWLAGVADPSHLKKTDGMAKKESSKHGVI